MSWRASFLKKVVILRLWPEEATSSDSSRASKNQNSSMKWYVVFNTGKKRKHEKNAFWITRMHLEAVFYHRCCTMGWSLGQTKPPWRGQDRPPPSPGAQGLNVETRSPST